MSTLEAPLIIVAVLVVLLAVVATGIVMDNKARARRGATPENEVAAPEAETATAPRSRPRAAIVLNPTKFDDIAAQRDLVANACAAAGWDPVLWLETTVEEPGGPQTRRALAQKVDLVMAAGGDGTVRAVAEEMAGTGVPLALLPAGTGNLLARNLDLDVTDSEAALRTALTGRDRPVDVGRIGVDSSGEDQRPSEHVFCVMAGLGFDAAIMAGAPEALKARVGWLAYFVAGARELRGRQTRVRVTMDGDRTFTRRVRTVVIGNCGRLTGGIQLMPDAEIDDGWLDAVILAPQGLAGWAGVAAQVITRQRKGHRRVEHLRCREITITADRAEQVQIDGDPIGRAHTLRMSVDRHALLVRVPQA